jgi:hypothetical protein
MICEDQVFVVDVMVIDLTQKTMVVNVISQPTGVVVGLNTNIKIHKYGGLNEGHRIFPMAMEVHNAPRRDMDRFIKKCSFFP